MMLCQWLLSHHVKYACNNRISLFSTAWFFNVHFFGVCTAFSNDTADAIMKTVTLQSWKDLRIKADCGCVWSGRVWCAAGVYLFFINLFVIFLHDLWNIYFPWSKRIWNVRGFPWFCWGNELLRKRNFSYMLFYCGGRHFVTFCCFTVIMYFLTNLETLGFFVKTIQFEE